MKMKKILSMGAIGLVLACSTSIGVLGAERPTNAQIKKDIENAFINDKNALNYSLNTNTVVSNVVNTETIKDIKYYNTSKFPNVAKAIDLMVINKNKTFKSNITEILKSDINITDLLSEIRSISDDLRKIENTNDTEKLELETDIKSIISGNTALTVNFGKNIDGRITMSVLSGNQIVLQLNSANAYTINESLNSDKLNEYVNELKLALALSS